MGLDYSSVAPYKPLPHGLIKASVGQYVDRTETHWLLFDSTGKQISSHRFTYVGLIAESTLKVGKGRMQNIGHKEIYGLMTLEGKMLSPFQYAGIERFGTTQDYKKQLSVAVKKPPKSSRQLFIINRKGNLVNSSAFQEIQYPGKIHRAKRYDKYGFLDEYGKVLIPFIYDQVGYFTNDTGTSTVQKDNLWGVIDHRGKMRIPHQYHDIRRTSYCLGCMEARKGNNWGIIDSMGKEVIPFAYQSLEPHGDQMLKVKKGAHYGILKAENFRIPPQYRYLKRIADGPKQYLYIAMNAQGIFGILDSVANVVVPFEYNCIEKLKSSSEFLFVLKKGDKEGILDGVTGEMLYPCIYDQIRPFRGFHPDIHYQLSELRQDSFYVFYMTARGEFIKRDTQAAANFGYKRVQIWKGGEKQYAWQHYDGQILSNYYDALHSYSEGWSLCVRGKNRRQDWGSWINPVKKSFPLFIKISRFPTPIS